MNTRTLNQDEIQTALLEPGTVLTCPSDVVSVARIRDVHRVRFLRWEYDVREKEVAQEEKLSGNLPAPMTNVPDALAALGAGQGHEHPSSSKQGGQ